MNSLHHAKRGPFRLLPAASFLALLLLLVIGQTLTALADPPQGYYRFPAIRDDTILFTAEGDLWKVAAAGGVAQRLTSHPGNEEHATISPDGLTVAFAAQYEGPTEVYTMPLAGGLPKRVTFTDNATEPIGWTEDGKLLYSTHRGWSLPNQELNLLDTASGAIETLPLAQACSGVFDSTGRSLYFTRTPFNTLSLKRYKGGTVENIWKYTRGETEARPMTVDYPGVSRWPLWWNNRVYFATDRDGTMNLWSMNVDGGDLQQLTRHKGWDVKWPALSKGRIVYQLGADLRLYDIATGSDRVIPISLASDFDHEREKWVKKPLDFVTSWSLSPDGSRVALTARGQVFTAPTGPGRLAEVTRQASVRYRNARFLPDGKSLVALSDESGEVEFTRLPANGVGKPEQLTKDGKVLRWEGVPSPDGKWLAWTDKDLKLWVFNLERRETKLVGESPHYDFQDLSWSPDSRWLAYAVAADNQYTQIWVYYLADASNKALTSDRVYSRSPVWSRDGKWIYFLSERHLESVVASPWGPRQPEPFFDRMTKIYAVSLTKDGRSPFEPPDELHPATKQEEKKAESTTAKVEKGADNDKAKQKSTTDGNAVSTNKPPEVVIDWAGIANRVWEVPAPPGNYSGLSASEKRLFWTSSDSGAGAKTHLQVLEIGNDDPKPKNLAEDVQGYELSSDGKKLLIRKGDSFYLEDSSASAPARLEKSVDLKDWTFSLNPRDEWRQMFVEAWRLERDYFYDRDMHGVNWPSVLKKYLPTVDRVTDRAELSDLINDMVGELVALHIRVNGGDHREPPDNIKNATLGAELVRDEAQGGWRVAHIYASDPDYPEQTAPLARPGVNVREGDVIVAINGVPTLSAPHPRVLLRNQGGKQVLLSVKSRGETAPRDLIVKPMEGGQETGLRYAEWEYTRRQRVETAGRGELGYLHLRAMSRADIAQWARDYYPVYNRKGLILDVRHNGGGNIDSWILEKLMRKAWFYWQPRAGKATWNMQYAFRGPIVVLCDEFTGSDGEAFSEGFKRLGLGKLIGKRTWGGEIWLSGSNWLVDKGIATSAEIGVYGPEGQWLIENHGVDPDIVVDNPPHATFLGEDAQLQRAIEYLQEEIRLHPVEVPKIPPYPDKSLK